MRMLSHPLAHMRHAPGHAKEDHHVDFLFGSFGNRETGSTCQITIGVAN